MKVLHVTNAYPYKENPIAGIFVKEQVESLDNYLEKNDVYIINAQKNGRLDYLKAIWTLKNQLNQYDVVHAHHIYVGFLLLLLSNKKSNNVLVSLMSDPERKTGSFITNLIYKKTYQYCEKYARAIIFKKGIPPYIKRQDIFYLPNGVNMDLFSPISKKEAKKQLELDESKKYVLFVSAMSLHRKEKRYDRFQAVMRILKEKFGMSDLLELTMVNVERNNSPLYYNAADLCLLVSDVEGSPNSVKESMACNTPVVSTDVGNVKAMIGSLENCEVVSSFDEEVIAEAVYNSLNNPEKNLRAQLEKLELSQVSVAKKLSEIYKCL